MSPDSATFRIKVPPSADEVEKLHVPGTQDKNACPDWPCTNSVAPFGYVADAVISSDVSRRQAKIAKQPVLFVADRKRNFQ